ncbi:tetratricopeptide repeat protein [Bremerella volcania]|uniref:Tetratricopeptide repeat protein n=2 Tax=Bremerella volcania TaxID=2527984 RepID=A0A518C953_9BACT|nr:tetratricopeptide repeat protein [Bremerella volcania]
MRNDPGSWMVPLSMRVCSLASLLAVMGVFLGQANVHAETLTEAKDLFRTGEYAKCVEVAAQEIEGGRTFVDWYVLKTESELTLGRYADAAQTIDDAKKVSPTNLRLLWLERDVRRFNGQSNQAKEVLAQLGAQLERTSGIYRDLETSLVIGKFFLEIGADAKRIRIDLFKPIQQRAPGLPNAYIAAAELALSKNDYALAAEDFQLALKVDEDNPRVLFGLAQAFEPSDSEKAEEYLQKTLEINPKYIPGLLMIAESHLSAERYDETEKLLAKALEINPHHPSAWAIRAVLAHLANDTAREKECREKALAHWKDNPEVDYLIGKHLARKYRFAEAAAAQRRALQFDSNYLPAKMELSNDLLRLGKEEQGWKLAEEVFDADNYNVVAHNLSTLQEHVAKFRTIESDGFIVRMDAEEAAIYGDRVLQLLREAKSVLCKKYDVELNEPIAIEIFPKQQDFAIRTFGLPGGAGFLGVCFGNVITMNSPASQTDNPTNWEAVLWHEFCHVVTLNKTHNKMPRWLSEGISVYEEIQRDPSWGQSISPAYREMILGDDLTPVSELSGAFLRPPSSKHLMFAYYESSLVVEFLVDEFGIEAVRSILDELGKGLQINDAIARHAAPLDAIDAGFQQFIQDRAQAFAPEADFGAEDLPQPRITELQAWLKEHPNSYPGLQMYAAALIREQKFTEALEPIEKLQQLAPDYAGDGSPLPMKAQILKELGETQQELAVLEQLAKLRADAIDAYRRLAELHAEAGQWQSVVVNAKRIRAVNPLIQEPYLLLAKAGEQMDEGEVAIEGLSTLAVLHPYDPADVHFRLAQRLHETQQNEKALRHVLLALEEAPRYRAALKLLLELTEHDSPLPDRPSPAKDDSQ